MRADTIPARLMRQAKLRPTAPAYYTKQRGEWLATDWATFVGAVRRAARAMIALGFQPGDTVAMLGFNRPEWVTFDLAAMCAGGVPAGVYTTSSPEEVQYIASHAEARLALVEDETQWRKLAEQRDRLPRLEHIVAMTGATGIDDPKVLTWDAFCARGDGAPGDADGADDAVRALDAALDERIDALEPDGLATLIYTSGTTGPPKGVMLSHENLSWTANLLADLTRGTDRDWVLSYLPLSHIAEQMSSIHGPVSTGGAVYYAESLEKVADNLREVQPTVFFGVPRIWEKFHAVVSSKLAQATGARKLLLDFTRAVCSERAALANQGRTPGIALRLKYAVADKLVLSKLKPALGLGKARLCASGAAPISREVLEFFASLDLLVHEVYGQSEDTGPTSFNLPGSTRFGTVGTPVPGIQVELADDGEILVKGPHVFMGYYKDPEATSEALADGWLHSGDLGAFDDDGFLTITGRKKDIIITAGGKNIAPKNLEAALKNTPYINEAVVIGDRRRFLSALITLDEEAAAALVPGYAPPASPGDIPEPLRREIDRAVAEVNSHLAKVETIKKYTVLPKNFTVERGELTPTLKVKRQVVNERYAAEIDAMYAE